MPYKSDKAADQHRLLSGAWRRRQQPLPGELFPQADRGPSGVLPAGRNLRLYVRKRTTKAAADKLGIGSHLYDLHSGLTS